MGHLIKYLLSQKRREKCTSISTPDLSAQCLSLRLSACLSVVCQSDCTGREGEGVFSTVDADYSRTGAIMIIATLFATFPRKQIFHKVSN
jgi:hypothetical protein